MSTIESAPKAAPKSGLASLEASGQAPTPASPFVEGFEQWVKDFNKYESMLSDVAKISLNPKYKEELNTVEQWFKETTITERTATMYHLLQISTQDQLRFFTGVIQRLHKPDQPVNTPVSAELSGKPKLAKLTRPPSLNLPMPGSPSTPTPLTATKESAVDERSHLSNLQDPSTWTNATNAGNTPLLPLFQKTGDGAAPTSAAVPGLSTMNPYTLNMLANAGLSPEAQLLAVQLIMSGLVQPTGAGGAAASAKPAKKQPGVANWRNTPTSARYPVSALRSSGLRASALKSAGLKSAGLGAGLESPALDSPKPEDFEPEMLNDIPGWLRSLRLHKYTSCFDGLSWQEMISLDDAALEAKGVAALGARRRLLRTFEIARKKMGLEDDNVTPTSTVTANLPKLPEAGETRPPHSAVPITRSKLSINSPVFTPTSAKETKDEAPAAAANGESVTPAAAEVKA
ncbi:hypothetical protein CC1G_02039 [Coprinopsis cinerea okayama7|uniref:SAM domain-containing protein n=1 Tax=Coprinopsis cinerea (strain Okayama-7 / 130 / ATCC MYA-4618 / FGSC 9003) TaxID=240176 RepID=A8N6D4_COPC7|nr:hypothetical protein CC1G_02039 [Coprinopsis cinerea okayama7\|eukprot:XP_001830403.1 hypothetical protein CC1G_02039 [Coprinopsis cinerea okayama7\